MEMENISSINDVRISKDEDDDVTLPGFRFHPTDEELVGFYLTRKVEKKPISIELIKQIDIYKYDPSILPKGSNVGDSEWYFFCKRGRKYRNSVRPNRVITGSGFWKATGIDKPIYSSSNHHHCTIIGLKKSLVYYRGIAGKGTKTDWMMHEFRLPPPNHHHKTTNHSHLPSMAPQEAEVWTLCRILKRKVANNYKKCIPADWKLETSSTKRSYPQQLDAAESFKICSLSLDYAAADQGFINFGVPLTTQNENMMIEPFNNGDVEYSLSSSSSSGTSSFTRTTPDHVNAELLNKHDWDELRSVVEFAAHPFPS